MKLWVKMLIVTLVIAIPTLFSAQIVWPNLPDAPTQTQTQSFFFTILEIFEALLLGFGVAFFIFTGLRIRHFRDKHKKKAVICHLAITWLLISWWPHDNINRIVPTNDLTVLLMIEYVFHFSLYIVGVILAWCFISLMKESQKTKNKINLT